MRLLDRMMTAILLQPTPKVKEVAEPGAVPRQPPSIPAHPTREPFSSLFRAFARAD